MWVNLYICAHPRNLRLYFFLIALVAAFGRAGYFVVSSCEEI